jgi:hypothetical protein
MKAGFAPQFLSALILMGTVVIASAEETGWLTGYVALRTFHNFERQGYMPVKVACRDSNKRHLDVGETEYNITLVKKPAGVRYLWAVGASYGQYRLKAAKEGYRQISIGQYTRKKSGLTVRCAIWQK